MNVQTTDPPRAPRIGSLFSGSGMLDEGVRSVLGGAVAWHVENDPAASKVLTHRYPDVPNHDDVTKVDWAAVEPVDVITGGYPCQPFSLAGGRQGVDDSRHLWPYVADAVGHLRPEWCVFENVRGHLSLGFDQVLRDLDLLHYEAHWALLRASDVGAAHARARLFILGRNRGRQLRSGTDRRGGLHRHRGSGWLDAGASQGLHDGQGTTEPAGDAADVRWGSCGGSTSGREDAGVACLATQWQAGCGSAGEDAAEAVDEGGAGADRSPVPGDGRRGPEADEPASDLGRGDAPQGASVSRSNPGGEPEGPGRAGAHAAAGPPSSGQEVRRVVGTRRGSVRASGVLRSHAGVGADDRRSDVPTPGAEVGSNGELARPAADPSSIGWAEGRPEPARLLRGPDAALGRHGTTAHAVRAGAGRDSRAVQGEAPPARRQGVDVHTSVHADPGTVRWGELEPAIRRWERILGRPAPHPVGVGSKGQPKLSPEFDEWLMGWPEGWASDVPGVSWNDVLAMCGNGVVPQQAGAAVRFMLARLDEEVRWAA